MPLDRINHKEGIDYILRALQAPVEQKSVFQKRKFLADFEQVSRFPSESLRAFANRYRRIERNLDAIGISVSSMYDAEARGNRLLERSRLSMQDQRLILVGSRHSLAFDDVMESMVMQFPDFRSPPAVVGRDRQPVRPKGSSKGTPPTTSSTPTTQGKGAASMGKGGGKKVWVAEQTQLQDIPEEDEDGHDDQDEHDGETQQNQDIADDGNNDDEEDDGLDLSNLAEVLTVTARRLQSVKLGRKFANAPKKSPQEMKASAHCLACGELGHWKGDDICKVSGSKPKGGNTSSKGKGKNLREPHQAMIVETPGLDLCDSLEGYGNLFTVNAVFQVQQVSNGAPLSRLMILDAACQRTCCGLAWLSSHVQLLRDLGLAMYKHPAGKEDRFQFGKGQPVTPEYRACFPATIGGKRIIIGAGALNANIPLLGSNVLLDALGMVLDLPQKRVHFAHLSTSVPVLCVNGRLQTS